MARITWLGEAECAWNNVVFPPGVPVEIDDAYMLGKARNNPFFKVEDTPPDVSFFDDPPGVGIMPETWTNDALPLKRKRGRPPKVRDNVDQ